MVDESYQWHRFNNFGKLPPVDFQLSNVAPIILEEIASTFARGQVLVLPTETVYGFCGLLDEPVIRSIFKIKKRPPDISLPIVCDGLETVINQLASRDDSRGFERLMKLATAFWPGALTIVVNRSGEFNLDIGGGTTGAIGVRVSANPLTRLVAKLVGPMVATSANLHGTKPMTKASEVDRALNGWLNGQVAGGITTGASLIGEASTVVDVSSLKITILRTGPIAGDEINRVLGEPIVVKTR